VCRLFLMVVGLHFGFGFVRVRYCWRGWQRWRGVRRPGWALLGSMGVGLGMRSVGSVRVSLGHGLGCDWIAGRLCRR